MNQTTAPQGRIQIRDVELAYDWRGSRSGRPFVLVHGFTGSSDDWADHMTALSELGPTLNLDLRGHGASTNLGREAAYTLEEVVGDLIAALDVLGIERCDLLGHSMGGMVALRFALAHPDRLASLVLMDTSDEPLELAPPEVFEAMLGLVKAQGTAGLIRVIDARADQRAPAQRAYEARVGAEKARARIEAKLRSMDPEAFVGFARALQRKASLRERLHEITCPTLVVVGDQDAPFIAPSAAMAEHIPDAVHALIPDAAHSPQLENPDAWFAAIRDHLERARRT